MDEPVRITDEGDGTLVVALFGDIDFANSPSVRESIRAAMSQATPAVVKVDLAAVTFLDSSGISVLVMAHRLSSRLGARYRVVNPTSAVYEHLRLTGLADLFGVARPGTDRPVAGQPGGHRSAPPVSQ